MGYKVLILPLSQRSWDCSKIFCETAKGWDIIPGESDICHQKPRLAVKIQPLISCFCGKNKTILWDHKNMTDSQWTRGKKITPKMGLAGSGLTQIKFRVWTIPKLTQEYIKVPRAFCLFPLPPQTCHWWLSS